LEDEMKGREVAFGYLIDDKFVHKFFLNQVRSEGLQDVTVSEGPFKRHVKASLTREAALEAGCPISTLKVSVPRGSGGKEEAIIAAFFMRGPTYVDRYPPTVDGLDRFKKCLFLDVDDNPKWHILR
jgi:hypothetical protein